MAEKVTLMKSWFDEIKNDPYVDTTNQEMAYIMYAALQYGLYDERIDIGEVFGNEFKGLNRNMSNIYGQIDRIKSHNLNENKKIKYDSEAIKELRLQGKHTKEICEILGYPLEKANSLTSNKGWVEAGKILKERSVQNNTDSVQDNTEMEQKEQTESVQKNIDLDKDVQKNTESVQNTQKTLPGGFNF